MSAFELSPDAEEDIWSIWQHLAQEAGQSAANRIQSTIFDKIKFLAKMPGVGHWRRDIGGGTSLTNRLSSSWCIPI